MTIHAGHRHRLRERFRKEGLENFEPCEVLELLLFYGRARGDVNPLSHRLLEEFGSLPGVMEASMDQLLQVEGVGEETAAFISLMLPLFRRYEMCCREESRCLTHYTQAQDYCIAMLRGLRRERFCIISLSSQMDVLGKRVLAEGSLTQVPAYPRVAVAAAISHNAHGVILCHNHPGGKAKPSAEDIAVTRELEETFSRLRLVLVDHIIVADGEAYSMQQHGDFECSLFAERSSWLLEDGAGTKPKPPEQRAGL